MERLRSPGRSLAGVCPWAYARSPAADPLGACRRGWTIPRTRRRPASSGPTRARRRRARPANSTRSRAPRGARARRGASGTLRTCRRSPCRGTRRRAPRCAALRASARTRVRVRVRVCAHEGALLLRGLGSCAAPCAQRVRVRVRVRVGVLRGALEHEGVHAVGVHLEHVHALDAPRRHERVDGGRL